MPDGVSNIGPYPVPPNVAQEKQFRDIIESTGRPEDIPLLSWDRPDTSILNHKIVVSFAIPINKRRGADYIPCSLCGNSYGKFLSGAVLWSPDGNIRLIGHICAAKNTAFGESRYQQLQRARRNEDQYRYDESWLLTVLPRMNLIQTEIESIRSTADFIFQEMQKLKIGGVFLLKSLQNVLKNNEGRLTVERRISTLEDGDVPKYETNEVGILRGRNFLLSNWKPTLEYQNLSDWKEQMPSGDPTEFIISLININ